MAHMLLVGVGGFAGSIARYWLSGLAQRWAGDAFPIGTLMVNAMGCLAIGVIWSLVEYGEWFRLETRLFLSAGVLGGFTTFSAFGYETFALLHDRQYATAIGNIAANVIIGLAGVTIGWMAGKALTV